MIRFQSLILILIILVSVLLARPSGQNTPADISVSVAAVPDSNQETAAAEISIKKTSNQENNPEPVQKPNTDQWSAPQPAISAEVASLRYLDNVSNIYELNADKHWPIASLTKLMTAVIAVERGDLNKTITINENILTTEGEIGGFTLGEVFKADDLLKAMLTISSNDAAVALAESISPEFVKLMNQKADELNLNEIKFDDPTGLSFLNQSTVNDLAKLMNYIYYNNPQILEITRQKEVKISELNSGTTRRLININQFAGQPDFIGGKTGYTEASGGNLISLFNKNERPVLIIVLGSKDRFGDTEKLSELTANH